MHDEHSTRVRQELAGGRREAREHPSAAPHGHEHASSGELLGDVAAVRDGYPQQPTHDVHARTDSRCTTRPGTRSTTTTPSRIRTATPAFFGGRVLSRSSAVWSPGDAPRRTLPLTRSVAVPPAAIATRFGRTASHAAGVGDDHAGAPAQIEHEAGT